MNLTIEEKLEKIKNLRPIDTAFFEVLVSNKSVCEEILRTILEDSDLIVKNVNVKNDQERLGEDCSRLDGWLLKNGIEAYFVFLRSDTDEHVNRALFVASEIIVKETIIEENNYIVPDVYLVYITESDVFNGGKSVYHVVWKEEKTGEILDDGLYQFFVNAESDDGSDIAELMKCFTQKRVNNPKFPNLSRKVEMIKTTTGGATVMCKVMEYYEDIARKEGKIEGKIFTLINLVKKGLLSVQDGAIEAGLPEEDFLKLLNESKQKMEA